MPHKFTQSGHIPNKNICLRIVILIVPKIKFIPLQNKKTQK